MRRLIILLTLFLSFIRTWGKEPHFQVVFSEPLAVFEFVDNLSANAPGNPFKKLFDNSRFNQEDYKTLLDQYDQLNIDYGYEYEKYPYAQKIGGSTRSLLKRNLLNCQGIEAFRFNSFGIIPNRDLFLLSSILQAFDTVYLELVYRPNQEVFERQLKDLERLITSQPIEGFFETGLQFYHSSWDTAIPFKMAFYPLPNAVGFTATAFYNNAESAIPSGLKDYNKLLSVMLHEIFHILYDEQSLSLKSNIEKWFTSNKSKNSRYAYLLLNESLATSLGNGFLYGQLNGKEDTAYWYRRKYTNLMAKAIYPLVKEYILKQRSIDHAFIEAYIQIYDEHFSGWLLEVDNLFTDRYVLSDNPDALTAIGSKFPYRSMSQYDHVISESSLDKMKRAPITKVVIISNDHQNKLQLLKRNFEELKNWEPNSQTDFTFSIFLSDKTYLIVINNVKKTTRKQIDDLKIRGPR